MCHVSIRTPRWKVDDGRVQSVLFRQSCAVLHSRERMARLSVRCVRNLFTQRTVVLV